MAKKQSGSKDEGIFKKAAIWYGLLAIGVVLSAILSFSDGTYIEIYSVKGLELLLYILDIISGVITLILPFLYLQRSIWSYRLTYIFITSVSILSLLQMLYSFFKEGLSLSELANQLNTSPNMILLGFLFSIVIIAIHIYLPTETRRVILSSK